jgi:hypothetical protein
MSDIAPGQGQVAGFAVPRELPTGLIPFIFPKYAQPA